VANAFVLRHYTDPSFSQFQRYYEHNLSPVPNYLSHLTLAALMSVWSPVASEKIFLSAYTVLLPLAARFACSAIGAGSRFLVLLIFPFVHNVLLLNGFYNFCLGLPMFFLIVAYCLRTAKPFRTKQTFILSGMLIVQYFCHAVPLVVSLLVVGIIVIFCWWAEVSRSNWLSSTLRHVLPLAVAVTPLVALASLFLSHRGNQRQFSIGIVDRLIQLATCYSLVSYDRTEVILSTIVAATFVALIAAVAVRRRQDMGQMQYSLLGSVIGCTLLYLVSPNSVGAGTFITERLLLFVYFCLLLWLASFSFSRKSRVALQATAVAVSLSLGIQHIVKQRQLNGVIEEFLMISSAIAPNTTVFPFIYSFQGVTPEGREMARRVMPFANLSSWIAAERGVVDLHNYQAWTGDFPLRFRRELDPMLHLSARGGMYKTPPAVDLLGYPRRTGGEITYVILWSIGSIEANPRSKPILDQLAQAYERVATSTPNGYARLYRLRVARERIAVQ
jgi:hypothetical protein